MKPSAIALLATFLTAGCAADTREETPASTATSGGEQTAALQRSRLEAARRHPVATPEPRPLYPEKAPPPREQASEAPPGPGPAAVTASPLAKTETSPLAKTEAPAAETRVVATQQPPAPYQEDRPPAPAPSYVWAPGYWYWYSGSYVWIHGRWLAPRHGYSYVEARWVYSDGGWLFVPGGWALGFSTSVTYPVYLHRHLYHHHHGYRPSYRRGHHHQPNYGRSGGRSWRGSSRSHRSHSGGLRRTTARPRR